MVKKINLTLLATLFVLYGAIIPVYMTSYEQVRAEEAAETTADDSAVDDDQDKAEDVASDKKNDLKARLEKYKEKRTERLAAFQEQRLKLRCKAAQGKIATLEARMNNIVANRKKVYTEITEKLDKLIVKLQAAGIDTTELETAREDAKAELATVSTSLDSYETILADLSEMDCTADPEAFQAALEQARETRKQLHDDAQNFRRFVLEELRDILKDIRQQLAEKAGESTDEDNASSNTSEDEAAPEETNEQ